MFCSLQCAIVNFVASYVCYNIIADEQKRKEQKDDAKCAERSRIKTARPSNKDLAARKDVLMKARSQSSDEVSWFAMYIYVEPERG